MYKRKIKVGKLKNLKWYQIMNIWKIFTKSKKEKLRDLAIAKICRLKYLNTQKYVDMRLFWFDYCYWPKNKIKWPVIWIQSDFDTCN